MTINSNADDEDGGDVDALHYEKVGGEWEVGPVGWGGGIGLMHYTLCCIK